MLTLHLGPIFKARGIDNPFSYLVKNGFTSHSAHRLIYSTTRTFRLDHIEALCRLFLCEPNDLLLFTPDAGQQYPANHPLSKLSRQEPLPDWKQNLANLPLHQLREVVKQIGTQSGG